MTARRLLLSYGSQGVVKIPSGPAVFDVITGDTTNPYSEHSIQFVPYPLGSIDNLLDFGLDYFETGIVTFMLSNVDTTTLKIGVNSVLVLDGINVDIQKINAIKRNGKTLAFEAMINKGQ